MKIRFKKNKFRVSLIGIALVLFWTLPYINGNIREILSMALIALVPFMFIVYVITLIVNRKNKYVQATNEKFVCVDKKRNINFEADINSIKISKYYWKREKFDQTYDIPVVKIESNDGQSVSFLMAGLLVDEWVDQVGKVEYIEDYDIELEYEDWGRLVAKLKIFNQLRRKPVVVPEKIREPLVKIMYLALFGLIGLAGYFLYWALFVEKVFEG